MSEKPKIREMKERMVSTLRKNGMTSSQAEKKARECAARHDKRVRGQ